LFSGTGDAIVLKPGPEMSVLSPPLTIAPVHHRVMKNGIALLLIDIQDSFKVNGRWARRGNPEFEANVTQLLGRRKPTQPLDDSWQDITEDCRFCPATASVANATIILVAKEPSKGALQ
jgi:hypothetical protein